MRRKISGGENDSVCLNSLAAGKYDLGAAAGRCNVNDFVFDRVDLHPSRTGQGLCLPEQEVLEVVAKNATGHELLAKIPERKVREVGPITQPFDEMRRQIRERRHIAGDHIEQVFRARRPVRDSAAGRIIFVKYVDA